MDMDKDPLRLFHGIFCGVFWYFIRIYLLIEMIYENVSTRGSHHGTGFVPWKSEVFRFARLTWDVVNVTKNIVTGHRSDIAMKVGDQVSSRGVAPKPPGFSTHAADSQIFYTHDRTVRKKK